MSHLLKKLWMDEKQFVTAEELKKYCRSMRMDYASVVSYFVKRKYFVRVLRGIFYVKSLEEAKLGRSRYNHLEMVAKALQLKKVKNWHFGLHTALKLNNMTHETFAIEDVISDKLFRANPVNIAGYKFKFTKLSASLFGFGIKNAENELRYSDPERTILDFIYLWRYNGRSEEKITSDIGVWANGTSKEKLRTYSKKYPKTVAKIAARVAK